MIFKMSFTSVLLNYHLLAEIIHLKILNDFFLDTDFYKFHFRFA